MVQFDGLWFLFLVSWDDTWLGGDVCDEVESMLRSSRRHAVAEAKMTGKAEKDP